MPYICLVSLVEARYQSHKYYKCSIILIHSLGAVPACVKVKRDGQLVHQDKKSRTSSKLIPILKGEFEEEKREGA